MSFQTMIIKDGNGNDVEIPVLKNNDDQQFIANSPIPFDDMISMGLVAGVSKRDKWGKSDVTSLLSIQDAWDGVGEYVFTTGNTITHVRGSDTSDNGKVIRVFYQLEDGTEDYQDVTLGNGGVYVALTTPCYFVYRMQNISSTRLVGNAYASVGQSANDADIKAIIIDGNGQTEMAIDRIPKAKVGFLKRGEVNIEWNGGLFDGTQALRAGYWSRRTGQDFILKKSVGLISAGTSVYQDKRTFKDVLPALTEIKVGSYRSSDTTLGVGGAFELEFWDESFFSDAFLIAIGQPGY